LTKKFKDRKKLLQYKHILYFNNKAEKLERNEEVNLKKRTIKKTTIKKRTIIKKPNTNRNKRKLNNCVSILYNK